MNKIESLLPPPENLFHQAFSHPPLAFLSLVTVICVILYAAKAIYSRRIFLIIDETKTAFDPHYRNLIEEFCKKYFKVSTRNFQDQLNQNFQIPRNRYNKVVVFSGILRRREDTQTDFYQNLGAAWGNDLIIFYGSSEGNDFSIPSLAQTAQVSLCSKDHSDKKVTDNLENFFKTNLFEEFRGIISASILAVLLLILFVFAKSTSPIGQENNIFEMINQTALQNNTTETNFNNFDDLISETFKNETRYSENITKQTEENNPSKNPILKTSEIDETKKVKKRGQNRLDTSFYDELGKNDTVWASERDQFKGKIVNSKL